MRVVSTKVTLTTGKKVKVYYISEAFRRELEVLLDTDTPCVLRRLNELEAKVPPYAPDRLRLLEALLEDSIMNKLYSEMRDLVLGLEKSFRESEITRSKEITPFYWILKAKVFQTLIVDGIIEARGGNWFRRRSK